MGAMGGGEPNADRVRVWAAESAVRFRVPRTRNASQKLNRKRASVVAEVVAHFTRTRQAPMRLRFPLRVSRSGFGRVARADCVVCTVCGFLNAWRTDSELYSSAHRNWKRLRSVQTTSFL
jgi:hypothetical protein